MKVCEASESQHEEDDGARRVLTYRIHDLPDQTPLFGVSVEPLNHPSGIRYCKISSAVWENGTGDKEARRVKAVKTEVQAHALNGGL
ncbi:hypothetical protein D8674_041043 [Pyrus ussuriensis x Pyrus communis]|uniref:Uncharacterized protein n=1 Tax=Pyrus ussuriensis x Pyrus communis TaxID=2448454 RepID=A0A5N5FBX9_9ROSA|nr:hypothetical protein D8674_041043 [Pyrus ussuriensis x Pyrus communis]